MPPKLKPEDITGVLDELVVFAETNAATLATRSGTDMPSLLRNHHRKEAHRRQVADAYA